MANMFKTFLVNHMGGCKKGLSWSASIVQDEDRYNQVQHCVVEPAPVCIGFLPFPVEIIYRQKSYIRTLEPFFTREALNT